MITSRTRLRQPLFRRGRTLLAILAAFTMLWMLIPTSAQPAQAAGGTLNLSLEAVNSTVQSGAGASFRIQWNCSGSGTCDNGRIEVPVPTAMPGSDAFPDGVPLAVTSQSGIPGGTAAIEGTAPDQVLVWNLPVVVPTGDTGTVTFTLTPPNSVTPDGATITPVAAFTADEAATVVANENGAEHTVVESDISLRTSKRKHSPTDVPYVNQQVTYEIMVGYEEQFPAGGNPTQYVSRMTDVCNTLGVQALENLVLVDTLEPGAEFISATQGGVYDEDANTVTWDFGSSIDDASPYACHPGNGVFGWTPPRVTVRYPTPDFAADPSADAVTNSVVATANAWGQPDVALTSDDSTSHALREGSAGATVAKSPGYDWSIGAPLYRGTSSGAQNHVYYLTGTSLDANPAQWEFVDMMPCALVSPTDPDDTDCATPGFIDLNFSADRHLPELDIAWTTNAGTTGVCTIPAGFSSADNTKRFCDGTTGGNQPAPGVPAGEWITKIEVDTEIPAFGGGRVYIHGTPNPELPTENVDTVYNNPSLDVDRSDVHPWYVTVENCPISNTITFQSGQVWNPAPDPQYAHNNGGICGYRQVMTEPYKLRPAKAMYDPAISSPPAVPAVQTGDSLTVDLDIYRGFTSAEQAAFGEGAVFTPTVTEYLPDNLVFDEDSLEFVGPATFVSALGDPQVDIESVVLDGEDRQKITISFPDATIPPGNTSYNNRVSVRFQVQVKDGVPAGTYTNTYLLSGDEAGPGIGETYLVCTTGTMVDADLNPTDDHSVAIGCLMEARYTVLPVPGAKVEKTVQGSYDEDPVDAPGIGQTSIGGDATYTIDILNSGSVNIRNMVAYDILPRVDDTLILPGASESRNSEFPVRLTGAVDAPADATVQYSTSDNPCRGDLAGTGGGTVESAPAGCDNDWAATPVGGDYSQVTAIRIDFGTRVFTSGESEHVTLDVHAAITDGEALDGIAWNNAAIVAQEASSGRSTLPIEQTPVGLQVIPDLSWSKVDGATQDLLSGSEWTLAPAAGDERDGFPMTIEDCAEAPCSGPDQNPAAGQFTLSGIPWGEYELTETVSPTGYIPLDDPIEVSLTPANVDEGTFVFDLGNIENTLQQGEWSLAKTSDPASGSVVAPGDTVTYTLTAANDSDFPVLNVAVTDDLSEVLNNATFGSFTEDDGGLATRSGETITWNVGELAAGETRTISYTVQINEDAKGVTIRNVVTGEGDEPPTECTPDDPCETTHETPAEWSLSKTSDPASGSQVNTGDTITYTLTAVNASDAAVADVTITDGLSEVLNHATFGDFTEDDGGLATRSGETITWNVGELAAGETRTISYTVQINEDAKGVTIRNVVTGEGEVPPTDCTPLEPCGTTHDTPGEWSLAKTSDPASGSTVATGDTVTYTLTAKNTSGAAVEDIVVRDDLSQVLNHAAFGAFTEDDGGLATRSGNTITWNLGELAAGETRTVSYTVTVNDDAYGATIRNVVTGEGSVPPTACTADEPCETTHETPEQPATPAPSGEESPLAVTGGTSALIIGGVAAVLLLTGAVVLARSRRKVGEIVE